MNPTPSQFEFGDEMLVAPFGEFPHPSGVVQVLDHPGVNTMIAAFDARAMNNRNFPGLLVDFDHFSYEASKPSTAAGWITGLVKKHDGLWANVRWTGAGADALKRGDYRRCSPVFTRSENLGGNRVRPFELDSVGLTNSPNIDKVGVISNRLVLMNSTRAAATLRDSSGGQPLTLQRICESARVMSEAEARRTGRPFTDSWNLIRNRFPVMNRLMAMPRGHTDLLLNRVSEGQPAIGPARTHEDPAAQERFWTAVEKAADSVRDRFHSDHSWDGSPGSEAKWNGSAGYYDALAALKQKFGKGADRDFLWEEMQKQYPEAWANFILANAHAQGIV